MLAKKPRGIKWDLPEGFFQSEKGCTFGRGNPSPRSTWPQENPAPRQNPSPTSVLSILSRCLRAILGAGRFSPSAPGEGIGFANSGAGDGGAPERDGHNLSHWLRPCGPEPNFACRDGGSRGSPGNESRGRKLSYRPAPRCRSSGCWVARPLCPGAPSLPGSPALPPPVASPRLSGPPQPGAGHPRRPPALGWFHGWT